MRLKKFLASIIVAAMLVMSVNAMIIASPADIDSLDVSVADTTKEDYLAVNGVIKEIRDYFGADGEVVEEHKLVVVEFDKTDVVFIISEDTYFFEGSMGDLKPGANITGLYNIMSPMLRIYVPHYRIEYLAVGHEDISAIKVDRFDENFVCSKNQVKLILTNESVKNGTTEIIYEDGTGFDGDVAELANRKLLVYYNVITRSIPGITVPEKIIIFYEKITAPIYTLTESERKSLNQGLDGALIQVNGEEINNRAFISDNGFIMVPVRAISEAAGFQVEWFGDTQSVQVGRSLMFTLDTDSYAYNRMAPVSLGEAPVLRGSFTYVPIDFFISSSLGAMSAGYVAAFDEDLDVSVINIIFYH